LQFFPRPLLSSLFFSQNRCLCVLPLLFAPPPCASIEAAAAAAAETRRRRCLVASRPSIFLFTRERRRGEARLLRTTEWGHRRWIGQAVLGRRRWESHTRACSGCCLCRRVGWCCLWMYGLVAGGCVG
ncbi:hypothetical protein Tsubulata_003308, partial [Turnera subulata]